MGTSENAAVAPTPCAGVVVVDEDGRLLVVLRAKEPSRGCWTVPGGHVHPGEDLAAAAAREAFEETGLQVAIGAELGVTQERYVDAAGRARVLEIHDFAGTVTGGNLQAADDAADARWVSHAELAAMPLTPALLEILAGYSVQLR